MFKILKKGDMFPDKIKCEDQIHFEYTGFWKFLSLLRNLLEDELHQNESVSQEKKIRNKGKIAFSLERGKTFPDDGKESFYNSSFTPARKENNSDWNRTENSSDRFLQEDETDRIPDVSQHLESIFRQL